METSSGTINSLSSAHLVNTLPKNQKCLQESQSGSKTTEFITLYVQSLQKQKQTDKETKVLSRTQKQEAAATQQPLQGKVGGLNLRSLAKSNSSPLKTSITPTKTSDGSPPTNGRTWKYASVVSKTNLVRRPLHPEDPTNANIICSSPNEKSGTPLKAASTSVIVSPHSSNSNDDEQNMEQFAVCKNCGTTSKNFTYCEGCQKALPRDVKIYRKPADPNVKLYSKPVEPSKMNNSKVIGEPIAKKAFYGKIISSSPVISSEPSPKKITAAARRESASLRKSSVIREPVLRRTSVLKRGRSKHAEPVCLTISSDEEEDKAQIGDSAGPEAAIPDTENQDTTAMPRIVNPTTLNPYSRLKKPMEQSENLELMSTLGTQLRCRSVRIGSFKVIPTKDVGVSPEGIFIDTPTVQGTGNVSLHIAPKDLVQVMCCFGRKLPILFVYTTPGCSGCIRNKLKMSTKIGPCYDPCCGDETKKRITLLPERLSDDQKRLLITVFSAMKTKVENREIMMEIDNEAANSILVRSSPTEVHNLVKALSKTPRQISKLFSQTNRELGQMCNSVINSVNLMTYPPPPQMGGITISSDDFCCLEEGQFLNDAIIDFYLKYLFQNKLSEKDRERTHIFSSFFYRRLMFRPTKRTTGEDEHATPAENRHSRVKTWTKSVDIFAKDFIIIPINENSHWFLAVICFPYLESSALVSELDNVRPTAANPQANATFGADSSANISLNETVSCDDGLGLGDEAMDCSDHAFDFEEPVPSNQLDADGPHSGPASPRGALAQPCILIFDSLPGPSRGRLLAALREYLRVEWQVKKKTARIFDRNRMKGETPIVPLQSNYSDCGIYLLQYVESFFETSISSYSIPIKGLQNWFSDECVSVKRTELRQLIKSLMMEQQGRDLLGSETEMVAASQTEESSAKDENQSPDSVTEES